MYKINSKELQRNISTMTRKTQKRKEEEIFEKKTKRKEKEKERYSKSPNVPNLRHLKICIWINCI